MKPLLRKGDVIEYVLSGETKTGLVHHSNPKVVWVQLTEYGKLLRLHKSMHKVKKLEKSGTWTEPVDPHAETGREIIEASASSGVEGKEVGKPSKSRLDDLFKELGA